MPLPRKVLPEQLDSLPPDDPAARRSRRELRVINRLMRNSGSVHRALNRHCDPGSSVLEVGAGDGILSARLHRAGFRVTALDRIPRPPSPPFPDPESLPWLQEDLESHFSQLANREADPTQALVGNLFWHHFDEDALRALAPAIRRFSVVIAREPLRTRLSLACGATLSPFVGPVTRHDMRLSIGAGFVPGELPHWWGLASPDWRIHESTAFPGSYQLVAERVTFGDSVPPSPPSLNA